MLAGRARVHAAALSYSDGRGRLRVPVSASGEVLHLAGNLGSTHSQFENHREYDALLLSLDGLNLQQVKFIKVDVESAEFIETALIDLTLWPSDHTRWALLGNSAVQDNEGRLNNVLQGVRHLLARERPTLLLELLAGNHLDPRRTISRIAAEFNYEPLILHEGRLAPANDVVSGLKSNSSRGTSCRTRNVIFRPR